MRRTLIVLCSLTLLATACSSDSDATSSTEAPPASDMPVSDVPATDRPDDPQPTSTFVDVGPPPTNPDKPTDIAFPGTAPDKLVVDVLSAGEGPTAEVGDTVIVDYIGVRSLDGVEFDNSYDEFKPFAVGPLGNAPVIPGWNEGLIGVQAGERLQLDVPSELAYGSSANGDTIRSDEPLTFVIDVRSVIKVSDPADAPTETGVEPSEGATELSFEDLREGDGATLELGQTAVFHLVLFRGDNGVELDSTWTTEPIQIPIDTGGFPAIVEGMPGMKVGGRRAITAPPELGFGPDGDPQIGLPANTDIVLVVDLLGLY